MLGSMVPVLCRSDGFGSGLAEQRTGSANDEHARIGILAGSLITALVATVVLRTRNRHYQLLHHPRDLT